MTLAGTNIYRNNKRAELLLKRTDFCVQYYFQTYCLAITSVFQSNSPYIFLESHLIFNERNGLMLSHPTEYLQSTTNGPPWSWDPFDWRVQRRDGMLNDRFAALCPSLPQANDKLVVGCVDKRSDWPDYSWGVLCHGKSSLKNFSKKIPFSKSFSQEVQTS